MLGTATITPHRAHQCSTTRLRANLPTDPLKCPHLPPNWVSRPSATRRRTGISTSIGPISAARGGAVRLSSDRPSSSTTPDSQRSRNCPSPLVVGTFTKATIWLWRTDGPSKLASRLLPVRAPSANESVTSAKETLSNKRNKNTTDRMFTLNCSAR